VEAAGGQVLTVPLEPGYSTTSIAEQVQLRASAAAQDTNVQNVPNGINYSL
jgi:hypothetical protein